MEGSTEPKPNQNTELKAIFDPSFSTLGHGTRIESAQKILTEGLHTKQPDLLSTTVPLFEANKSFESQITNVVNKMEHWEHNEAKAVVIVMIPNPDEGEIGGITYFNSVFKELSVTETNENTKYLIPPNFIKGYYDSKLHKFILNPKFKAEKPVGVVKPNTKSEITKPTTPIDIPVPSNNNSGPDIW